MQRGRIYLDHNATTPLRPEVRAAMAAAPWGNPSSVHAVGRQAREAVERSRREVATFLGCLPEEVIFTSGGTEGDNLAIRGLARGRHVVSSPLEHPAVKGALVGLAVTYLPVGPRGEIAVDDLRAALRPDTALVTLAAANHELGNVYPLEAFAAVAHQAGALFHTDAVQAAGRIPLDLRAVDAATISAHKLHGPPGVGALYLRRGLDIEPLMTGGHQERERRAGTENLPGIVGFGEACRLARIETAADRIGYLRAQLQRRLMDIPGARVHGDPQLPGTLNVGFDGADGQLVMVGLDLEGICVSTGSACTSGSLSPSPVLLALGLTAAAARQAVRFSLGRDTTEEDIDRAAEVTAQVVGRVRAAEAA